MRYALRTLAFSLAAAASATVAATSFAAVPIARIEVPAYHPAAPTPPTPAKASEAHLAKPGSPAVHPGEKSPQSALRHDPALATASHPNPSTLHKIVLHVAKRLGIVRHEALPSSPTRISAQPTVNREAFEASKAKLLSESERGKAWAEGTAKAFAKKYGSGADLERSFDSLSSSERSKALDDYEELTRHYTSASDSFRKLADFEDTNVKESAPSRASAHRDEATQLAKNALESKEKAASLRAKLDAENTSAKAAFDTERAKLVEKATSRENLARDLAGKNHPQTYEVYEEAAGFLRSSVELSEKMLASHPGPVAERWLKEALSRDLTHLAKLTSRQIEVIGIPRFGRSPSRQELEDERIELRKAAESDTARAKALGAL